VNGLVKPEIMRIVIADDEPIARSILRDEIAGIPGLELVGEAEDGLRALALIGTLHPDLVILDLEMPVMGGFEMIANLGPIEGAQLPPSIIIATAYNEHAIRAFEAGAIDYLLKPVSRERLVKSVERGARLRGHPLEAADQAKRLAAVARSSNGTATDKIVGRSGEEYFLLDAAEVLAFLAEEESVWVVTAKRRFEATHSLRAVEERVRHLPFQRVHRNALVNVNHVRKMSVLSSQRWLLTLTNGFEITVSKRQAQSVRTVLNW
jgi:DNA-binding LytR/AlgR family response regulator